jgi:hypothetical protein
MPWANDGGDSWNATRCSPVDPAPKQTGEACSVEGSSVSGIDDCDVGTMCFGVDPATNQGVCVDLCDGNAGEPICEDPATDCFISNDGVLIVCVPPCDPLLTDCGQAQGCYPDDPGAFFCLPDTSGDQGVHGDACDHLNDCDPGLLCAPAESVAGCAGPSCCTEFCDLDAGDPNAACSGFADGEMCVAYFDAGQAPPGLAHVGVCIVPGP